MDKYSCWVSVTHNHYHYQLNSALIYIYFSFLKTPDEFKKRLESLFKNTNTSVVDIFSVPNYKTLIEYCLDKELANAFKTEDTKLQWKFEKIPSSESFPL